MASLSTTELLHLLPPARALSGVDAARLADHLSVRHCAAGNLLFEEGDRADELLVVVQGALDVLVRVPGGESVVIGRVGRGEILGELGVIDGTPRSASVRAVAEVQVLALPRERYQELARQGDELARWLLDFTAEGLARRIAGMIERVADHRIAPPGTGTVVTEPGAPERRWWSVLFPWRRG